MPPLDQSNFHRIAKLWAKSQPQTRTPQQWKQEKAGWEEGVPNPINVTTQSHEPDCFECLKQLSLHMVKYD